MSKKPNHFQKNLKFHCFKCETVYQLNETHSQAIQNCSDNCLKKWQEICHEYYQEKVLGYISQQEEAKEKDLEQSENYPDWLKKQRK